MKAGCVLDNKYEIVDILGTGGMGKVYLARNISLNTLWAIKELSKTAEASESIKAEVDILKNLDHPSLPKVFDIIETRDSFFIIFTYIKGISLKKKLSEAGSFDERKVAEWGIVLCDVLSYLHNLKPKPIIYRDLKPSNIMLTNEGEIKLIDFGIAREYKPGNSEDTVFIGTRGYAAPEQYGLGQSGPYTDIYSLGITLKQLLTGESPLSASFTNKEILVASKELINIIEKCTNPEINKRYSNTSDIKEELKLLLQKFDGKIQSAAGKRVVYKIEKKAFYKQRIISMDNAEFTSELAVAGSKAGLNVLLVDIYRFAPVCDFYLGIQKQYREFIVMKEPESNGQRDTDQYISNMGEYIYTVSGVEGLSYLSLEGHILNKANIKEFLGSTGSYDLVLFSANINYLSTDSKELFDNADKILIADEMSIDRVNYWNRVISNTGKGLEIFSGKTFFAGWLYNKNKHCNLSDIMRLLNDIKFVGILSDCSKRYFNTSYSSKAAILNYRDVKKEYRKILFNLDLSPAHYTEGILNRILNLLHIGRKKFEQETYS